MRRRRPILTSEQRNLVVEALNMHSSAAAVARSMDDVSVAQVKKVARQEAIVLRDGHTDKGSRDRIPADQREYVLGLLRKVQNAAEVSRRYPRLSHSTLGKIARMSGIILTASVAKSGGPHLSKQKRLEIAKAVKLDPNAVHVADRIGNVSATTVRRIAQQERIPLTAGLATKFTSSLSAERRASIVSTLREQPNAAAAARQVGGVGVALVRKIARDENIELVLGKAIRKKPSLPAEIEAEIVAALRLNSNAKAVARQIGGATHTIVLRLARKEGIDLVAGRTSGRGDRKSTNPRKPVITPSNQPTGIPEETLVANVPTPPAPLPLEVIDHIPVVPVEKTTISTGTAQRVEKVGPIVENLVRALSRAQVMGDKKRVSLLIANTDPDLLRDALAVIRTAKAKPVAVPSTSRQNPSW